MATTNDITGDSLVSRMPSQAYKDNYDRIFGKKEKEKPEAEQQKKENDSESLKS